MLLVTKDDDYYLLLKMMTATEKSVDLIRVLEI